MQFNLKRGYPIEIGIDDGAELEAIGFLGSYSKCGFSQTLVVKLGGLAPTVTGNHGEVAAIEVEDDTDRRIG